MGRAGTEGTVLTGKEGTVLSGGVVVELRNSMRTTKREGADGGAELVELNSCRVALIGYFKCIRDQLTDEVKVVQFRGSPLGDGANHLKRPVGALEEPPLNMECCVQAQLLVGPRQLRSHRVTCDRIER